MFDTHRAVRELTEAGFAVEQAEAVVATVSIAMNDNVATKADIAEVKTDVAVLRAETKAEIDSLKAEMKAMENRIVVKMTGIGLAIAGLTFALIRLLG